MKMLNFCCYECGQSKRGSLLDYLEQLHPEDVVAIAVVHLQDSLRRIVELGRPDVFLTFTSPARLT